MGRKFSAGGVGICALNVAGKRCGQVVCVNVNVYVWYAYMCSVCTCVACVCAIEDTML